MRRSLKTRLVCLLSAAAIILGALPVSANSTNTDIPVKPVFEDMQYAERMIQGDEGLVTVNVAEGCGKWYKVRPVMGGEYMIHATGHSLTQPFVALFDNEGNRVDNGEDEFYTSSNDVTTYTLYADLESFATYYIWACCLDGDSGTFGLNVRTSIKPWVKMNGELLSDPGNIKFNYGEEPEFEFGVDMWNAIDLEELDIDFQVKGYEYYEDDNDDIDDWHYWNGDSNYYNRSLVYQYGHDWNIDSYDRETYPTHVDLTIRKYNGDEYITYFSFTYSFNVDTHLSFTEPVYVFMYEDPETTYDISDLTNCDVNAGIQFHWTCWWSRDSILKPSEVRDGGSSRHNEDGSWTHFPGNRQYDGYLTIRDLFQNEAFSYMFAFQRTTDNTERIESNSTIHYQSEKDTDYRIYSFTPESSGTYTFSTSNSTANSFIALFDSSCNCMAYNDRAGSNDGFWQTRNNYYYENPGEEASITAALTAGNTYYYVIKVIPDQDYGTPDECDITLSGGINPTSSSATQSTAPNEPTSIPHADIPVISYTPTNETGVAGFVERLYSVALGRQSDPVGKQDWIDAITLRGETGASCARGFLYSNEFLSKQVTNEVFVAVLYRTFFDREPDQAGFDAWVNLLNNGTTKEEVIEGFINSTEWANLCLRYGIRSGGSGVPSVEIQPNQQTIEFATRLYTTCLRRNADQNGLMAWARQLANQRDTGTGAARGFFFSSEFTNQNVSNRDFVRRLYLTFMDREPDESGYNAWVTQLDSGVSREEVFNGFALSPEFSRICADYGIIR